MSQGQRKHIPSWLRRMRGWQEAPDWLLELIQKQQGFSFIDLGTRPEEAGFAPVEGIAADDETETELSTTLEWEHTQPSSEPSVEPGDEAVPEAGLLEQEEGTGSAAPPKRSGVTDWLVELDDEASAEASSSTPREIREQSGWAAEWEGLAGETFKTDAESLPESSDVEAEPPVRRSGITDWLTRLEEPPAAVAAGPQPAAAVPDLSADDETREAGGSDSDMPDWLAGLQAAAPEEDMAEGQDAGRAPDWLTDLEGKPTEEEGLLADRETGMPPWLAALEGDEAEEDVPEWLAELDSGGGISAWLAEQEGEAGPPGLAEEGAESQTAREAAEQPSPAPFAGRDEASLEEAGLQEDQLPNWLRGPAEATEEPQPGPEQEADVSDWLAEEVTAPSAEIAAAPVEEELPDWLRDLGEATAEPQPGAEQEAGVADWLAEQEMTAPPAETAAAPAEEELSDWLSDRGEATGEPQPDADQEAGVVDWLAGEEMTALSVEPADEETPDWLRDLNMVIDDQRPDTDREIGIVREAGQVEPTSVETVAGPGEVENGDEEMPDWLRGLAIDEGEPEPDLPSDAGALIPDWLSIETPSTSDAAPESQDEEEPGGPAPAVPDWMEGIYAPQEEAPTGEEALSLPPPDQWGEGAVPEWLTALQDEGAAPTRQGPAVETSGPLAGLSGVLSPEPILANFPRSAFQPIPSVPDAHQAEAELVERALETPASRRIQVSRSAGREILNSLGRWVIYGLLLAAVLIAPLRSCVRLPDFGETRTFYNAIEGLPSGSAVLVVFDYDASLDGTLTPQARAILWHLQHRDLGIVLLSLTPQGAAIAEDLIAERERMVAGRDYVDLGYLPPHPASLLAFMSNPLGGAARFGTTEDPAETILGREVRTFADLDMIVTITGDRDHVRWWIEQVRSRVEIDLLAAVPAAITPYVEPYYSELGTGQIVGILGGLGPTAQYEELIGADFVPSARLSYIVETNALLLFTCVVLVSGLGSLLGSLSRRGAPVKARGTAAGVE